MDKKVSCSTLLQSNEENDICVINWKGVDITVKKYISAENMSDIIQSVVINCFDGDMYLPEMQEASIRLAIMQLQTDIILPEDDNELLFRVCFADGLFDAINKQFSKAQIWFLRNAVDEKIKYIIDLKMNTFKQDLNKIMSDVEAASEQLTSLYSSLSSEDIANMVSAISDGHLDEEKLVKAFLDSKQ